MISFSTKGNFSKTTNFLERAKRMFNGTSFDKYGRMGVAALQAATPVDSGETASSWYYEIESRNGSTTINWLNRHVNDGVVIAVILQYGHGTGTGGYVEGTDYINPAMRSVFNQIAEDAWKEVTR